MYVGRRFSGYWIPFHPNWVFTIGLGKIANIGFKTKDLVFSLPADSKVNGDKGGIFDGYPHFFNGRDEVVIRTVFSEYGGK